MSVHFIAIVPKQSHYPGNKTKGIEILEWLVSLDVIKENLSDCVSGSNGGYAISEGAKNITTTPVYLPFDIIPNGLEIVVERTIFHAAELDECKCPVCYKDITSEIWLSFDNWFEQKLDDVTCPNCNIKADINSYLFSPVWGFSDLGFIFWNWQEFKNEFIEEFKLRLGVDISIIYGHI